MHNPGIFGIEKLPIYVHYYVTKWHFMFCCKSTTAIVQDCMTYLTHFCRFTYFTMRKRGLCYQRCPSIWLSVTFVYWIQTAECIVKLLPRPRSHMILIFWPHVLLPNSKGNPFTGGIKYTGDEKNCDFWLKSPFISQTVRDRPIVAMEL